MERKKEQTKENEYGFALVASVIANVNRNKNSKAYKPSDFMRKEQKPMTLEQMVAMFEIITIANGGDINGVVYD